LATQQTENGKAEPTQNSAARGDTDSVGKKIREIRSRRRFSLRELAEMSGLSINTLSLVENDKTSPSVSTLQQLARALEVPMTAFFESEPAQKRVVYTRHDRRPQADFGSTHMHNLGKDLAGSRVQPFVVTLEPGAGSGTQLIVHTGHELVYCLTGKIRYCIDNIDYELDPGDSLVFESHLPHRWENLSAQPAQMVLTLFPADQHEEPGGRHFPIE
jgi:transcriptional regulator with XRE-family HTH domain